jgi:hypothetical protein
MTRLPEQSTGTYNNASWRYFSRVYGEYIEREIGVVRDWDTKAGWEAVKEYFAFECIYCGVKEKESKKHEKEHLDSVASGGLHLKGNVLPACSTCNKEKGNRYGWEEFIRLKAQKKLRKKSALEKAEQKIKLIEKYREDECKWKKVIKHRLYTNPALFEFKTDDMEKHLWRWVTEELYGHELGKYLYHVTTWEKWGDALEANKFPSDIGDLKNGEIPCSSENLLALVREKFDKYHNVTKKYVILSFDLDELRALNIPTKLHQFVDSYFIHIIGQVDMKKVTIIPSNPFYLDSDLDKMKAALESIPHSVTSTYKIKRFPGYDPKS